MSAMPASTTVLPSSGTPVVFVANEGFAVGLAVALRSLVQHTKPLPPILVVDAGLAQASRRRLEQVAPLHWVAMPDMSGTQLRTLLPRVPDYPSAVVWVKLFLPDVLPSWAASGCVLYLDCDVMARTGLQPLLSETKLQGRLLAAVRDIGYPCGHPGLSAAGWPSGEPYFNSGLLLIDMPKLRAASGRIQHILAQHGNCLRYHDQDVLNLLASTSCCQPGSSLDSGNGSRESATAGCQGWMQLGFQWNAQGVGTYARRRISSEAGCPPLFASQEELDLFERQPAVVHFTGPPTVAPSSYLNPWVPYPSKPWAYLCHHPHRSAFFAALDATPWHGWRPSQRQVAEAAAKETVELVAKVEAELGPAFNVALCLLHLLCLLAKQLLHMLAHRAVHWVLRRR